MNRSLTIVLVTFLMISGSLMFLLSGKGEYVDTFNGKGGPFDETFTLKGSGANLYDAHAFIEVEKNIPIVSASMKVETMDAATGPWINNPSLDMGVDNKDDWRFGGTGYGSFGRNTVFADDTSINTNSYSTSSSKQIGEMRLPADAEVISAEMSLKGRFEATVGSMTNLYTGGGLGYTPRNVKLGDINKNSINDAVVSTAVSGSSGSLYTYIRQTAGTYVRNQITTISGVYDFVIFDVDQDGDKDIVYCTTSGVFWIANDGTGTFSGVTTITTSFIPSYLALANVDKYGEEEIICGKSSFSWGATANAIMMLKRSSGSSFNLWPLFDTGSGSGSSSLQFLKVGDWNNDKYIDVYAGFSDYKVYTFQNPAYSWYYNDTTNITSKTKWTGRNVFTSPYPILSMDVGDMDKDGSADVVLSPNYYYNLGVYYYRNKGTSTWDRYTPATGTLYYPQSVSIADLTGDGYPDIFYTMGYGDYYYYNRVAWCTAGSNPNKNSWTNYNLMNQQSLTAYGAFAGDVNSDGYADVGCIFTSAKQILAWVSKSPHDGTNLEGNYIEDGGLVGMDDLEKFDVDADGDIDMLITAQVSGTVAWLENDGTPFTGNWPMWRINSALVGGAREVDAGDIDGDGDLDVAVTAYDSSTIMWFENTGDPKGIWTYHYVGSMNYPFGIGVGDMDKNGVMEIIVSAGYYYYDGVRMYYATNPKGSWSYRYLASNVGYCGAINLTDMNLDGYLDVLVTINGWGGTANIYRNPMPKSPMTSTWVTINAIGGLSYPYEVVPFDINNDGNLDVVSASSYNWGGGASIFWGECPSNRNSTSGWSSYGIDSSIQYPWGVDVTDVDNDGYADIFVTCHYWWGSPYYVYARGAYWLEETDNPKESFTKRTLDSSTGEVYGIEIADLDNNNQPEIYITSQYSNEFKVSRPTLNYPSNIYIDLGGDGTAEWTMAPGSLRGDTKAQFKTNLQNLLDNPPSTFTISTDKYGNKMVKFPVKVYSATLGRLTAMGLDIRYDVTFDIDNNGKLKESLQRLIPDYGTDKEPLRIYLVFQGETEGSAHLFDLSVEYNAPPKKTNNLPTKVQVGEDSIAHKVIDLSKYFKDDYDQANMLRFVPQTTGPYKDKLAVYMEDGANLTIDCTITKDFDKDVTMFFTVYDNGGPGGVPARSVTTSEVLIDVIPQNDPPIKGTGALPQRLYGLEGEEVMVIEDVSTYSLFDDPDDPMGSSIRYYAMLDPLDQYPQDLSHITLSLKGRSVYVDSSGDWYGENIPVYVYGYNDILNKATNAFHKTLLDIQNINDPPEFTVIDNVYLDEDTPNENGLDLSKFASDIDTPSKDLKYSIVSQTNTSFLRVRLDQKDTSKVSFEPRLENWHGRVDVKVEVTDGEFLVSSGFSVFVNSVNDVPSISIASPLEDQYVKPGKVSVFGESYDVEGISKVEIRFLDKWYTAKGTNAWGLTLIVPDFGKLEEDVTIQVKATDTNGVQVYSYVNITVEKWVPPMDMDYDGDGVINSLDKFPYDPSEWDDTDRDGWGDNSDDFPFNREWHLDSDKDGYADQADTHPFDPNLWNDKNDNGINDEDEGKVQNRGTIDDEENEKDLTIPIILYVLAVIALLAMVASVLLFVQKNRASKDPIRSVKYYNMMEKRRLFIRKVTARDRIEALLGKTQIKDMSLGRPSVLRPGQVAIPARAGPFLPPPPTMMQPPRPQLPPVQPMQANVYPRPPPRP